MEKYNSSERRKKYHLIFLLFFIFVATWLLLRYSIFNDGDEIIVIENVVVEYYDAEVPSNLDYEQKNYDGESQQYEGDYAVNNAAPGVGPQDPDYDYDVEGNKDNNGKVNAAENVEENGDGDIDNAEENGEGDIAENVEANGDGKGEGNNAENLEGKDRGDTGENEQDNAEDNVEENLALAGESADLEASYDADGNVEAP